MADRAHTVVVVDANVLINFIHIGQLDLLASLPGMTFIAPREATNEITVGTQARAVRAALASGQLREAEVTGIEEMERYADLSRRLGKGESACLALAESRDWSVASDEKRLFRRTAIAGIGEARILTTPDLLVHAIRSDLASVDDADRWKQLLAERRFRMKFESFADLL
ncbi:MAG: hypothetical protein U5K43_10255 [Halofilum sp. (in: g-proteobacteria)]|nr:hypothetical protein [Halofilum sp. (in: g-proteobacteria)]